MTADVERWVFGYGSLMWRPGFAFVERQAATLHGRRRAFCIYSVHHRGTYELPGLVLGLAPGGATRGAAYRVAEADWPQVYAYLLEREQPTETYIEARRPVRLADGRTVESLVFLSDVHHPQWAGALSLERQAELIARERGAVKLTLEVLSGNQPAMRLYERIGFAGYQLDPAMGSAQFLQKWL